MGCIHKVNYYETDKMGITHHSNYIRWMEEARVAFLDEEGYGYAKLETQGVISPVVAIECEYKSPTTFDDRVKIDVKIKEFNGIKFVVQYTMTNLTNNKISFIGTSTHCFVNNQGVPVRIKRDFPDFANKLEELVNREK